MFTALPTPPNSELVASVSDRSRWIDGDAEIRAWLDSRESRDLDRLMRERGSVCG